MREEGPERSDKHIADQINALQLVATLLTATLLVPFFAPLPSGWDLKVLPLCPK